jgi:hypothetical protein
MTKTNPKKNKVINQDSLIEQLKSLGGSIAGSVKSDVVSGISTDAFTSLFGVPQQGELTPGQPINLADKPVMQQEMPEETPFSPQRTKPDMFIDRLTNETINRLKTQESQTAQKIEEIRFELKALIKTISNVNKELEMAVNANVVDAGEYHLAFLDRIKIMLKILRQNINSSGTWLNTMKSRRKERKYWNMYKKKGTSFGLSNERSVSTQVG